MLLTRHLPTSEDMLRLVATTLLLIYSLSSYAGALITKAVIYAHKAGMANDLLVIADGGHGFSGEDNEVAGAARLAWFQDHLVY
ncbi:MAG: hypothetical protein P8L31_04435 [Pseudomonadales bacterium]|nr:hypothetical protein [Pseudomonadales bacterium]